MVTVGQLAEIIALDIFRVADDSGQLINMDYVTDYIDALKKHPPGCKCSRRCRLAKAVSAEQVYRIASRWESECNTARRLRALRTANSKALAGG